MKHKLIIVALLNCLGVLPFGITALAQPQATTLAATSIGQTNATLHATVNPNGALAAAYYQYGLTTNYDDLGGFVALPATNTAQTLPGLLVNSLRSLAGATWTQTSAPSTNWGSIASSADGSRLAAAASADGLYISTNFGGTWTKTSVPATGHANPGIASSADGLRLATVVGVSILTSTNGGGTWTETFQVPGEPWACLGSSADGSRLAGAQLSGNIYTSTNFGATWTPTSAPNIAWQTIASSADGLRLAAGTVSQGIYTSTNGGLTWTQTSAPHEFWNFIASSADGTRLAAAANASIFISTNSGATWTATSIISGVTWQTVASSADGMRLAAGGHNNNGIYTSTDGGNTWTQGGAPIRNWQAIASSADGTQLAAVVDGGGIYTSTGAAISLTPGTLYHYRAVGLNTAGTSLGNDLTFTTAAGAPTATTRAASPISATNATLNGTLTTGNLITSAFYQYGLTTNYGGYGTTNTLAATNIAVSPANSIGSLTPGTLYHFQLVVSNSSGMAKGGDFTFSTLASSPIVTTLAATSITATNATLNGTVNPNGDVTLAYFQYGLTTNYGSLGGATLLPATNLTLAVPGLVVNSLRAVAGANWTTTSAPGANWRSIASSADGSQLAAVAYGGGIYISTNSGATWTPTSAPTNNWQSVVSSANGTQLAAVVNGGGIYTSTNGGVTWTQTSAPLKSWTSIASSADGARLTAVFPGNTIYTSANSGLTWTPVTVTPFTFLWTCVACSADGLRLAATASDGFIYKSTDGGLNWNQCLVPGISWSSIASSADGARLAAVANNSGIYTSMNGGDTWTLTSTPTLNWKSIASSADGTRLAAVGNGQGIYTSTNSGSTWTLSSAPTASWYSIASSADGTVLASVVNGGGIYTSTGATTSLAPGTYHYRLVGYNRVGASLGSDLTFTIQGAPTTATLPATGITSTNATLNGSVSPNQVASSAYFRYGLTTNYGSFSATNTLGATNIALSVSNPIGGLTPGTTYHFQLVAGNSFGTNAGADLTFTTSPAVPFVITLAANGVTSTNASLNGTVNPNGAAASAYFRYGLTTNYSNFSSTNSFAATNLALSTSSLIGSLTPGTTYHYQLVAGNSAGTNRGADLTLTTGPAAPLVTTLAATGVTSTNASLNGTVNPNGAAASAYFRYGLTTNYSNFSSTNSFAATNLAQSVSSLIGSLTPGTTYHYQLVAGNSAGTNAGADLTFTTGPAVPVVTTLAATGVTSTNATLNGSVNPNGAATSAYFRFGLTTSYGSYSATNSLAATNVTVAVSNLVGSLSPGTTYHCQLVAGNSAGTNAGADLTFTAGPAAPVATTVAASGVTSTNASLNGSVNPNGAITSAYFRYGFTTNYGSYSATNTLAATNITLSVSSLISSLTPGTTYHFQLVVGNSLGTNSGADLSFTTGPATPVVTTLAATGVTSTNASLNGAVNPNGAATSAYFRYGLTTNYGSYSATNSLAATNVVLVVSNLVDSLTPGTVYHFQLVAGNSVGTRVGSDLTFTTQPAPPIVTSLPATGITSTNASLNGMVNPNGAATTAYFRFGLTTNYDSYSATNALAATNVTLAVSNLVSGLTPGTTYHFQLVAGNSLGTNAGADMLFMTPSSAQALDFSLNGAVKLPGGEFQFSFTNLSGLSFTVLATTDLTLALTNWTVLGAPIESAPGLYQFTDTQATNTAIRFYRVSAP